MPEEDEWFQKRLESLVEQWARGRVSLKHIVGLSAEELYAIASQGYSLLLQGKTQSARVVFEGLVALEPRNVYCYRALGVIYGHLKEFTKAIRQFTYAIRLAPREISSYVHRAEIYVATQQFQRAASDLKYALSCARPFEQALAHKAQAMLTMISGEAALGTTLPQNRAHPSPTQ